MRNFLRFPDLLGSVILKNKYPDLFLQQKMKENLQIGLKKVSKAFHCQIK